MSLPKKIRFTQKLLKTVVLSRTLLPQWYLVGSKRLGLSWGCESEWTSLLGTRSTSNFWYSQTCTENTLAEEILCPDLPAIIPDRRCLLLRRNRSPHLSRQLFVGLTTNES